MGLAMVFPGQGSQALGMCQELAQVYPDVQLLFEQASDVLGCDLWRLVQQGPQSQLDETAWTQPALLTACVATWRCWQAAGGVTPMLLAGHSLGEYSALVAAEVLSFTDAVRLVRLRGCAMQDAVPAGIGAMSAVLGLSMHELVQLCESVSHSTSLVVAANDNMATQVVVSGHADAVQRLEEAAMAAGANRVVRLAVSVPSHSPLMASAAECLAQAMQAITWHSPKITVLHNVDAQPRATGELVQQALVSQVVAPVCWTQTQAEIVRQGASCVLECGPGRVLSGLMRRSYRQMTVGQLLTPEDIEAQCRNLEERVDG